MVVYNWYELTVEALQNLWLGFLSFTPKLIGAVLILLIGWLVSVLIGRIVEEILKRLSINELFKKGTMKEAIEKAEFKVDVSGFIGALFKWIFMIVFLLVAVEILGLNQFGVFLTSVLDYLPNVITAALIFVVAVIIADFTEKVVRAAVESARVGYGNTVGMIVRWSILAFAILAVLYQLRVAPELIHAVLNGFMYLIVLGVGGAFALGGKDTAAEILDHIKRRLQK